MLMHEPTCSCMSMSYVSYASYMVYASYMLMHACMSM